MVTITDSDGSPILIFFDAAFAIASGAIDFTLMGLAGIPPTTVNGSTSFEATPMEPTIPCSPTFTPLKTVA